MEPDKDISVIEEQTERVPLAKIETKTRKKRKVSPTAETPGRRKQKCLSSNKSAITSTDAKKDNSEAAPEVIEVEVPEEKENVKTPQSTKKNSSSNKRKRNSSEGVIKINTMFKKLQEKAVESTKIDVICLADDNSDAMDISPEDKNLSFDKAEDMNDSVVDPLATPEKGNTSLSTSTHEEVKSSRRSSVSNTPKQLEKENARQQKKDEREKARLQREVEKEQLKEEKLEKEKERERVKLQKENEKEELRLQKEKEKEELRLQKEKEKDELQKVKEEKLKKKMEITEAKQKEKDEKFRKKEEEKLKKDGEKRIAEEEQREKKLKMKAKFANFFVAKKENEPEAPVADTANQPGQFMMFQIKENMKLAPTIRNTLSAECKSDLDSIMSGSVTTVNYLSQLKDSHYVRGKCNKTLDPVEKNDDCEILDEDDDESLDEEESILDVNCSEIKRHRAKLLLFFENRRPAYYGTWSKRSTIVTGRTPLGRETELFDYDYESGDDWEEEEAGESLSDSEGEDGNEEPDDQYEVDNDVFVPHGYLSDDEVVEDDAETDDEETKPKSENGEARKEMLKQKQEEFDLEMKQKTKALKPKVYGCVWMNEPESHPAHGQLMKILSKYQCISLCGTFPIGTTQGGTNIPIDEKDNTQDELSSNKRFAKEFPEKAMPHLIRLLHGNQYSKAFLICEFQTYWQKQLERESLSTPKGGVISKSKIEQKINEIGKYGQNESLSSQSKRRSWLVSKETLEKYNINEHETSNQWEYVTTPKKRLSGPKEDKVELVEPVTPQPKSAINLITRFTKVLNEDEKLDNLKPVQNEETLVPCSPKTPIAVRSVKRKEIVLTPIPLNNAQPKAKSSISKFFRKQKKESIVEESIPEQCITLD